MTDELFVQAQVDTARLAGVDLEGFAVRSDAKWGVGVHGRCGPGTNVVMMRSGQWWGAWFAEVFGNGHLGRLLLPGVPVADAPVMLGGSGVATTAAATPAAAVRFAVFDLNFSSPKGRARHADRWSEYRESLADLHFRLGGGGLERLDDVIADPRLMAPAYLQSTPESERLLAEVYRRLDPDPHLHAFLDWSLPVVLGHGTPEVPQELGPWTRAAEALRFKALLQRGHPNADAAWRLHQGPPALDCGMQSVSLFRRCLLGESRRLLQEAARVVATAPEREDDLLWHAVAAAAAEDYDGTAHIVAATRLRAAGEPDRAFYALAHAAFWLKSLPGRTWGWPLMPPIISLAEDNGWTDIAEVLRRCAPGGGRWNGPNAEDDDE